MGSSDEDGEVQIQSRGRRPRSCSPVPRPGEDFRASQSPCALGLGDAFQLPNEDVAGSFVGLSSTGGECSSKVVWRSRSGPSRPFCQGQSGVVCFCALFLQDALSEVTKIYPSLKLRVFCG